MGSSPISGDAVAGGGIGRVDLALRAGLDEARLGKLKRAAERAGRGDARDAEDARLREAARNFEAVFLHQLVKMMRATVEKSGLISGGRAEEIFQDMLDEEYAGALGRNANLGLADMIYKELKARKPQR